MSNLYTSVKAVYAGTFDPLTLGHWDLVHRSLNLFDEVHLVIAVNGNKTPWLDLEVRRKLLLECFPDRELVKVVVWEGLLVEYLRQENIRIMIRGIRGEGDLAAEQTLAWVNRQIWDQAETLWLPTKPEYSLISSSLVREMVRCGESPVKMVPPQVAKYLESNHV